MMKTRYLILAVIAMFLQQMSALADETGRYEKLASEYERAGFVKKYFQNLGACPYGICPDDKTASDLNTMRQEAIKNCATAWKNDDPEKGKKCLEEVSATPPQFISKAPLSAHPPPPQPALNPADPCAGYKCGKVCVSSVVTMFVCPDGSRVGNADTCRVTGSNRRWLILAVYAIVFLLMCLLTTVLAYSSKLRSADAAIKRLETELKPYKSPSDTWVAGLQVGQVRGTIPGKPIEDKDTLLFQSKVIVEKGGEKDPKK